MSRHLLATAPDLDSILASITDFYCGSSKVLVPVGDGIWRVVSTESGKVASGVQVRFVRGRYCFEMTNF